MNVIGIFPVPVVVNDLSRQLTADEMKYIESCREQVNQNEGNSTSKNSYVLNDEIMSEVKAELEKNVKFFYHNVMGADTNSDIYITQSWLNYTEKGQFHHKHRHPNSIISGVLYISVGENDAIHLCKNELDFIKPTVKQHNDFTADTAIVPVQNVQIVMFPSYLEHKVKPSTNEATRISLAFNTFIKGTLGAGPNSLSEVFV